MTDTPGDENKKILELLCGSPIFSNIPVNELEKLVPFSRVVSYMDGERIFRDSDPGQNIYTVLSGQVDVRIECITPNYEITIASFEAGNVFGEISFMDEKPRSATAFSRTNTEILIVNGFNLREVLNANPSFSAQFYKNISRVLCERIRKMNHKILGFLRGGMV